MSGDLVAKVVPDVTGLDKHFDYLVPPALSGRITVGSRVRVPLHGRRIGGWVVAVGPPDERGGVGTEPAGLVPADPGRPGARDPALHLDLPHP